MRAILYCKECYANLIKFGGEPANAVFERIFTDYFILEKCSKLCTEMPENNNALALVNLLEDLGYIVTTEISACCLTLKPLGFVIHDDDEEYGLYCSICFDREDHGTDGEID